MTGQRDAHVTVETTSLLYLRPLCPVDPVPGFTSLSACPVGPVSPLSSSAPAETETLV